MSNFLYTHLRAFTYHIIHFIVENLIVCSLQLLPSFMQYINLVGFIFIFLFIKKVEVRRL